MKIDANGAVSESGAGSDFGAGHALDETQDEGFTIGFGEGEDGVKSGVGFGVGVGSGGARWRLRIDFCGSGFFNELVRGFGAAMKIGGAIAGDGGKPAGEFGHVAEGGETREGLEENVVDEIIDIGGWNTGQKDAVDHAGVARIEEAEGVAIAVLSGPDEGVVVSGGVRRGVHGVLAGEWDA